MINHDHARQLAQLHATSTHADVCQRANALLVEYIRQYPRDERAEVVLWLCAFVTQVTNAALAHRDELSDDVTP